MLPILGQSGPGRNNNEAVLRIPKKLQHYWNLTIRLFSVICRTLIGGILPLCREAVSVFSSPPQTNWTKTRLCIISSEYHWLYIYKLNVFENALDRNTWNYTTVQKIFVLGILDLICIYPTPLPRTGCDTRSIFKQSLTDLNLEFSFYTSWHSKAK